MTFAQGLEAGFGLLAETSPPGPSTRGLIRCRTDEHDERCQLTPVEVVPARAFPRPSPNPTSQMTKKMAAMIHAKCTAKPTPANNRTRNRARPALRLRP